MDLVLRSLLTSDARERLSNVKMVNLDRYVKVTQYIMNLYQSGQIDGKIDDSVLKMILDQFVVKKEFTIRRK